MPNIDRIKKYKKIHMIGIGGVSMSGIAEILHQWGFEVTGSNNAVSEITNKLDANGIRVFIGHNSENITKDIDVVVYTAAISQDNAELIHAKELGIPTIERSDFLGEITRCYNDTIAISGTHGKTTTTSMVALCFLEALKEPSIQVGGYLSQICGNYMVGNSEYFIIESCEYVESFLKFSPRAEIILNIDNDHLDYFKNFENIKNAFVKYVKILPDDGLLVVNGDDSNCLDLSQHTNATCITYGITNKNTNFFAVNINFDDNGYAEFDVYHNNEFYERIKLSVPGMHNVLNCLSCIALCDYYGISKQDIKNAVLKFKGAARRFEFKGLANGASVYDDYGHHPTEIIATAKALMSKKYNKSWVVFQPHTYSRTRMLLSDFTKALLNFDNVIVLDIYAARESNRFGVSAEDLVNEINKFNKKAIYIPDFNDCVNFLKDNISENDIVLTLGAGTVTEIGPMLIKACN
ncbi:MAG: UDP-N-acetylmuramate--L-alanine ligase [Clostridia bacterium]|nr:UDP-N-acetylmuramate--L-alanine ligase [Clostridia bacterium]